MSRPALEIADIFRLHGRSYLEEYGSSLSVEQHRVMRDIVACRTSVLGGHVEECDHCGHRRIAYNSCRNRHCPKCQAAARGEWMDAREADLLDVPYFHLVFTLPGELSDLALQNKRVLYAILFRAAADTLKEIAVDQKHLGAEIGFLMVLHTWGQNLMHHPHVHCVLPGGGISPDGARWVHCKRSRKGKDFFAPVTVLSRVFRGKFIDYLRRARDADELSFHGKLADLANTNEFEHLLDLAVKSDWVVYAKRPFGGPRQVLAYLARYTHRVAISNQRLVSLHDRNVTFRWNDYANGNCCKTMTLDAHEFTRRFLLHVLPSGFTRIRHYGFLANRHRVEKLKLCRTLLSGSHEGQTYKDSQAKESPEPVCDHATIPCPACKQGRMVNIELIPATRSRHVLPRRPFMLSHCTHPAWDTS